MNTRFYVILIAVMLSGKSVYAQEFHYDVNNDGDVNITDAVLLVNYILGKTAEEEKDDAPCEAVDLGLPSGTKWASCNVGATKPEEYGGYYAWGETEEKSKYDITTYKYYQMNTRVDLGSCISGTKYDVAHVKWGGNWQMPIKEDYEELLEYCVLTWDECEGVIGVRVTGLNGRYIFMPASSFKESPWSPEVGLYGSYWGGDVDRESNYPSELIFGVVDPPNDWSICDFYYGLGTTAFFYCGRSVRPIVKK